MDRLSRVIIVLLFSFALQTAQTNGLTIKEIEQVKDIVKELCAHPDRQGYYMRVQGTLEGGTIVRIIGIKGQASLTREEWKGLQDVLPEDRAPDRRDIRKCTEHMTPLLLEKLEESHPTTKYREPQYYSGFGRYRLTPRDSVQLPYIKVAQEDRESPMQGTSKWPPIGYCRIRFLREGSNVIRTHCSSKYGTGGGVFAITHQGTSFFENFGAIVSFEVVDVDSMTVLVDFFPYQPKYDRRPDKVRPGDRFGSFKVGNIEAGWSNADPPDLLRVNIGEGNSSRYLTEGERYQGKNADVIVTKIGKDNYGHFARVKFYYR